MASRRLSDADLDRWVRDGVITSAQRDAILRDLEARPAEGEGLTLTTLLYYGGGLLVLLAYSVFLGFRWEELNPAGRTAIAAASLAFFGVISQVLLRSRRFQLPGELLQVVAVAVVPLLCFAILDSAGLWPDDPGYRNIAAREEYQSDLTWARMGLGGATLLAAGAAFWTSRSPFVLVAAAASFASLAVDVSIQLQAPLEDYEWQTSQAVAVAVVGAGLFAAGVGAHGRTERDYTLWLYGTGLVGLTAGLATKAFPEHAATGWGVLWVIVALTVLALSVPLQERLLAAAGLAGVFAYLAKLVFDVFQDANAALALVILGLAVLGAGMLYQRYSERLFGRSTETPAGPG